MFRIIYILNIYLLLDFHNYVLHIKKNSTGPSSYYLYSHKMHLNQHCLESGILGIQMMSNSKTNPVHAVIWLQRQKLLPSLNKTR